MNTTIRLSDLPLWKLRRILRDTERLVGPTAPSVVVLRRTVAAKVRAQSGKKQVQ